MIQRGKMTEYVRLSGQEAMFGEKHILHSELEILGLVKRIREFEKLRKEELILKLTLKKKLDETVECLKFLEKLLPHTKMIGLIKPHRSDDELAEEKESMTLEQEIEMIRRKIERLRV